jgi:hypothetical protein
MRRFVWAFTVVSVVSAGAPALARAVDVSAPSRGWVQSHRLRDPHAAIEDFGGSTALSADGRVAIVGAVGADLSTGAAYVYVRQRNGWRLQQELQAADGASSDDFGSAVALSADGRVAAIGAPDNNNRQGTTRTGATYVFVRTGRLWRQQQRLRTPAKAWYFGNAVALSRTGDVVLVGSWFANGGYAAGKGAAYVFARKKDRWREQQELDASDAAPSDGFGTSVALSPDGRTAVVGTPYPNRGPSQGTGATYLFSEHGSEWRQDQELTAPGPAAGRFGQSLSISANGEVILIGAPGTLGLGSAYLFARFGSTWEQTQSLQPSVAPFGFGFSVALSGRGRIAMIGALIAPGVATGAAYVFTQSHGSWQRSQTITRPRDPGRNNFGWAVALSTRGDVALIGAPLTNNDTGAAYVFTNPRPPPAGVRWLIALLV